MSKIYFYCVHIICFFISFVKFDMSLVDSQQSAQPKAKRVRCNPTKKWTVPEEKALIEFLMANRDFEKPVAQAYYRRFSIEANVEVDWKLTRAKVRNMRIVYNKAKAWEGSTGAGSMDGNTIKTTLVKMCTFFFELDDIFGSRLIETAVIEDSLDTVSSIDFLNSTELEIEESMMSSINLISESKNAASTSRKGIYSRTALADIMEMQSEMLKVKKQKIDQESKIQEQELTLKEKELALKLREVELKEKELKSNERLKIMELEMKERLAMEELNRKFK